MDMNENELGSRLWERLVEVADKAKIDWTVGTWPGEPHCIAADNCIDLSHELAHWFVATPKQRNLPWYGLGHPGKNSYKTEHPRQRVEYRASILGILLCRWLHASDEFIDSYIDYHNWEYGGEALYWRTVFILRNQGLVEIHNHSKQFDCEPGKKILEYTI